MAKITYRGRGVWGERSALARAMAAVLSEKGFGLDIGMGVYELAVDQVLQAQAAYTDEATEAARYQLPPLRPQDPA